MLGKRVWFRKLNKDRRLSPWKLLSFFAAPWRWKRPKLRLSFLDYLAFRVLYCLEAVVLVSGLCLFFLFCGCHI